MIARLKAYIIRRRFERFFVKPFEPAIAITRRKKVRGVGELKRRQQAFLHFCLGASRDPSPTTSGASHV